MSIFVWSMISIALWHFTIFIPDRFAGGIIGAFLAAWLGGMASGFALGGMEVPEHNPPGLVHAAYALPGSIGALVICYWLGSGRSTEPGEDLGASEGRGDKAAANVPSRPLQAVQESR
jgi:hypothetical protein